MAETRPPSSMPLPVGSLLSWPRGEAAARAAPPARSSTRRLAATKPERRTAAPARIAHQVVWGDEPIVAPGRPWADAATAAMIVLAGESALKRTATAPTVVEVIVVGRSIERHVFAPGPGDGGILGWRRLEVQTAAIAGDSANDDLERVLDQRNPSRRGLVLLERPEDQAWAKPLARRRGVGLMSSEGLVERFSAAMADAVPVEFDYELRHRIPRWGTSVPHKEFVRAGSANLHRAYWVGGDFAEHAISFVVERRARDAAVGSASILEARVAGSRGGPRPLEVDACPATGSVRFVLREAGGAASPAAAPALVFWPVARREPDAPDASISMDGSATVSVCLALERRSADRAWREAAPLVEGLRDAGRLARLQVVWSGRDQVRETRGWPSRVVERADLAALVRSIGDDDPNRFPCAGLSGALREALLLDGEAENSQRPLLGLIVVDRDYEPGVDRGFQSAEARWAWMIRTRRAIGAPPALAAYRLVAPAARPSPELDAVLSHLVILGRQAVTASAPIVRLGPGALRDPSRAGVELEAVFDVLARMKRTGRGPSIARAHLEHA